VGGCVMGVRDRLGVRLGIKEFPCYSSSPGRTMASLLRLISTVSSFGGTSIQCLVREAPEPGHAGLSIWVVM
jgi:hypothetical protein